jgi:hypothetical protein
MTELELGGKARSLAFTTGAYVEVCRKIGTPDPMWHLSDPDKLITVLAACLRKAEPQITAKQVETALASEPLHRLSSIIEAVYGEIAAGMRGPEVPAAEGE